MRLIDNIKDFTADLEDYVKAKDQEIEQLKAEVEKRKQVALSLQEEIFNLKAINETQTNRLTELSVEVDDAMKFVDQVRIVLFDVVRMYGELEKANESERTD